MLLLMTSLLLLFAGSARHDLQESVLAAIKGFPILVYHIFFLFSIHPSHVRDNPAPGNFGNVRLRPGRIVFLPPIFGD